MHAAERVIVKVTLRDALDKMNVENRDEKSHDVSGRARHCFMDVCIGVRRVPKEMGKFCSRR